MLQHLKDPMDNAGLSSELVTEKIGNKFNMVLVAATRVRELSRGDAPKVVTTSGHIVTALEEIEQGKIGIEYLRKLR